MKCRSNYLAIRAKLLPPRGGEEVRDRGEEQVRDRGGEEVRVRVGRNGKECVDNRTIWEPCKYPW